MADKEEVIEVKAAESSSESDDSGKKKIIVVVVVVAVIIAIIGFFLLTGEEEPSNGNGNGENRPPAAAFTYDPIPVYANSSVTFNGGSSFDPDDDELTYSWNFDDEEHSDSGNPNTANGMEVIHNFTMPGEYNVKLTVSDEEYSNTANETITVMPEETPTATLTPVGWTDTTTNIRWTLTVETVDGTSSQLALGNIRYYIYNGIDTNDPKVTGMVSSLPETNKSPPFNNADGIYFDNDATSELSYTDTFSICGEGGASIQTGDSFQLIYEPNTGDMCDPVELPPPP